MLLFSIFGFFLILFSRESYANSPKLNKKFLILLTAQSQYQQGETLYLKGIYGKETKNIKWKSLNKEIVKVKRVWNNNESRYEGKIYITGKIGRGIILVKYEGNLYKMIVNVKVPKNQEKHIDIKAFKKTSIDTLKKSKQDSLNTNILKVLKYSPSLYKHSEESFIAVNEENAGTATDIIDQRTNVFITVDSPEDNFKNIKIVLSYKIL